MEGVGVNKYFEAFEDPNYLETNDNDINMDEQSSSSQRQESQIEDGEESEKKHVQRIVNAYRSYKSHSLKRLYCSTKYISSLSAQHQELLKGYRSHLDKVRVAIEHNYEIVKLIIKDLANVFPMSDETMNAEKTVSDFDMEKVQSILKQMYREWSVEGKEERDASFKPILDEISLRFPFQDPDEAAKIQILVPGAALGRLQYEIAKKGFSCQGNEYNFFMLFASNFILNRCQGAELYKLYPFVHQYCNNVKACDQIQMVRFPDVDPSDISTKLDFSMAAGSYIEIYNNADAWDCIATCFFIDTAHNIIDYIETTWNILKPGGYWINLGPLLYHFADMPQENSIEPSYEEVRHIILKSGFKILKEELSLHTPYSQNRRAMMTFEYKSVFFVCQKPAHSTNSCS